MSQINPDKIHEKLVRAGHDWSEAEAIAELMEETKRIVISQLAAECTESSMTAKEAYAHRHPEYKAHIEKMVNARKMANKARVEWISGQKWADLKQTQSANDRATMRSAV